MSSTLAQGVDVPSDVQRPSLLGWRPSLTTCLDRGPLQPDDRTSHVAHGVTRHPGAVPGPQVPRDPVFWQEQPLELTRRRSSCRNACAVRRVGLFLENTAPFAGFRLFSCGACYQRRIGAGSPRLRRVAAWGFGFAALEAGVLFGAAFLVSPRRSKQLLVPQNPRDLRVRPLLGPPGSGVLAFGYSCNPCAFAVQNQKPMDGLRRWVCGILARDTLLGRSYLLC